MFFSFVTCSFSLCSGSYNQSVRVTKIKEKETECMSTIRHHDGFMGQRIGPVNTMSFHPHKVRVLVVCRKTIALHTFMSYGNALRAFDYFWRRLYESCIALSIG